MGIGIGSARVEVAMGAGLGAVAMGAGGGGSVTDLAGADLDALAGAALAAGAAGAVLALTGAARTGAAAFLAAGLWATAAGLRTATVLPAAALAATGLAGAAAVRALVAVAALATGFAVLVTVEAPFFVAAGLAALRGARAFCGFAAALSLPVWTFTKSLLAICWDTEGQALRSSCAARFLGTLYTPNTWLCGRPRRLSSFMPLRQKKHLRHFPQSNGHATRHCSSPCVKMSRGNSMPIKTILLVRFSSAPQAGPRSLPINWCTPWKMTLRSVPFMLSTPL